MAEPHATNGSRDHRGRFKPGCKGGPGRPTGPTEKAYLGALKSAVSLDDFARATKAILAKALAGDVKAWEALAKYCCPPSVVLANLNAGSEFRLAGLDNADLAERMAAEVVETFRSIQEQGHDAK